MDFMLKRSEKQINKINMHWFFPHFSFLLSESICRKLPHVVKPADESLGASYNYIL